MATPVQVRIRTLVLVITGVEEGEEKEHLVYTLAHVPDYGKDHMAELGACTNMMINGSLNSINSLRQAYCYTNLALISMCVG